MDPISAIFVMTVLGGLFVKGVDVATDGWFSAEVGAGVRGAGRYAVRAERARWGRARAKAREIRQRTPQGQAVQEMLDLAGLFGRTLFGELRRFGSGLRSEWETARDQARSDRTERRGDAPWPVTAWLRERIVRIQEARTATPNEAEQDPNGGGPGEANEQSNTCLEVLVWAERDEGGRRPFLYCGQPCEPGWRICPKHKAERVADPNYPNDDIDEWRADPDTRGPDAYRSGPDPNGDPNVPLPSTVPDANGDVKCGCCALLHKPLEPGEHCPNCHIHDGPNAPTDTIPNAPTTKGPSMADINTAPAAIAAWEALGARWESLQSRADALQGEHDALKNEVDAFHGEVAALADGMGDFAIGGETDAAAAVGELSDSATSAKEQADNLVGSMSTAKEGVDAYTDALHLEYDGPIEAAAGKAADVHSVMQEA